MVARHLAETGFSFRCTACGNCCNSPPRLSMGELFQHQDRFIGCIAVRRLAANGSPARLALFDRLAFRAPGPGGTTHVAITAQGYAFESDTGCPALLPDGRCALHGLGKPAMCGAVPLDPLLPDEDQNEVLGERASDDSYSGAACLTAGVSDGFTSITRARRVVDPDFIKALTACRAGMETDRRLWGQTLFDMLSPDLARDVRATPILPPGGYLALPLIPALTAFSAASARCLARCQDFMAAQLTAIGRAVQAARVRRSAYDLPMTRRLLGWTAAYRDLARTLQAAPPARRLTSAVARDIESWLGCAPTFT